MSMRIRGVKAAESLIARELDWRYASLSLFKRALSYSSATKLLIVMIPLKLFAKREFKKLTFSRTSA